MKDCTENDTKNDIEPRSFFARPGTPLLAALVLSLGGALLGSPAAQAGTTTTTTGTHVTTAPGAQPQHIIWGSVRQRPHGSATATSGGMNTPPPPITQHIIWGSVRQQRSHAVTAAVPPASVSQTSVSQAPAQAAPEAARVLWVRVRLYADGGYEFLPDTAGDDEMDADGLDDDAGIVTLVPVTVAD